MDDADNKLAHALKIRFGTAPSEPTAEQIREIKRLIGAIRATGKTPSLADWERVVYAQCPGAGRHKYAGIDNSDLNTLLAMATKKP